MSIWDGVPLYAQPNYGEYLTNQRTSVDTSLGKNTDFSAYGSQIPSYVPQYARPNYGQYLTDQYNAMPSLIQQEKLRLAKENAPSFWDSLGTSMGKEFMESPISYTGQGLSWLWNTYSNNKISKDIQDLNERNTAFTKDMATRQEARAQEAFDIIKRTRAGTAL